MERTSALWLVRTTLVLGLLSAVLGLYALSRLGDARERQDLASAAVERLGAPARATSGARATPDLRSAARAEQAWGDAAEDEAQATVLLGIAAIVSPLVLVLNVLGHAPGGFYRRPRPSPSLAGSSGSGGADQKPGFSGASAASSEV